jgi:uncharacterized protein (TIGR02594 family)
MTDLFHIALAEYGIKEIPGPEHNPEVLKYFHDIGHRWVDNDEMAWCSAFVNWCAMKAGYEFTTDLRAKSWLNIGEQLEKPELGCIVVLWRVKPHGPYGHVGLYIREDKDYIYILGGNQSNQVNIARYPQKQFLQYRKIDKTDKT